MRLNLLFGLICAAVSLGSTPVSARPEKTAGNLAATPAALPASQEKKTQWDWWFVFGGGKSPSREIIYIDALSVRKQIDADAVSKPNFDPKNPPSFMEADGVSIFENFKTMPARWSGRVRVKCDTQQIMFLESYKLNWQIDKSEVAPASPWFNANSDLKYKQISHFICKPDERNGKNFMMRVDETSDPLDRTWALAWNDVPRPKFTTNKTAAEIKADYEKSALQNKESLSQGMAVAETRLANIKVEQEFIGWINKNFKSKRKKYRSFFQPMIAWNGDQITDKLGWPKRVYMDRGMQVLVYSYQDTVTTYVEVPVDVMQCGPAACGKIGETTQQHSVPRTAYCERYLYLGVGGSDPNRRLLDYAYQCF
jgi:hypothetical protein